MIALSGGSTGADMEKMVDSVLKSNRKDIEIYAVTGKNKQLNANLNKLRKAGKPIIVQGFDKNWRGAVDSSDLLVLRPHGLTPTEAAARGTPFISAVTDSVGGNLFDSYAPHMVGNAQKYNKDLGSPIASLTTDTPKNSVSTAVNNALDNLKPLTEKATKAREAMIKNDAAQQIIDSPNATRFEKARISPVGKGLALGAAATLTGVGTAKYINRQRSDNP